MGENEIIDQILLEIKNNDISRFETLYDLTSKQLFSLAYSYLKDVSSSEDILQDTYLKIINKINKFKGKNGFNWMYTICKNICLNYIKRQSKIQIVDVEDESYSKLFEYTQEEIIRDNLEILTLLEKVLKPIEYQIVISHAVDKIKLCEIAKMLKKPEGSIRWTYNNALSKIRKAYERKCNNG